MTTATKLDLQETAQRVAAAHFDGTLSEEHGRELQDALDAAENAEDGACEAVFSRAVDALGEWMEALRALEAYAAGE